MNKMITTLLDFSRLGKVELRRQRVDLSALAKSIARELTLREQTRSVAFHIPEGLGTEGDLGLLQILLENLLGNAWKYTSKTAEPKIEVGLAEGGCGRTFFVRDNGAGFDPACAGDLFAPFKRLHDADDFEGFGIGLATVQRIVKRHGGKVWAEGFPGEGATIYFSF
jgi:light-regulated signal transduction histidine kinase (bacteriophytochrome)